MPFPISVSGKIRFPAGSIPHVDPAAHLEEALRAETVENFTRDGDTIYLRQKFLNSGRPKPRPGGDKWVFGGLLSGKMTVTQNDYQTILVYKFNHFPIFILMFILPMAVLSAAHFSPYGPSLGVLTFLGGYSLLVNFAMYDGVARPFNTWLRTVLTARELPPSLPLKMPTVG